MNDPKGSTWRQWDLHLHTPTSFDYFDKSVTNEQIVDALVVAQVAAIAVTDHHVIDVARIENMRRLAGERIVIFPGIEFRTELGGRESVHLVGLFAEDCDVGDVWNRIQGPLRITNRNVREKTDDRVYVQFAEAAELIHEMGGIVTVHAGRKANSIEQISNAEEFKQQLKEDLAREHIDILEIGSLKDQDDYRRIVFPAIGFACPLVTTSDNHDIRSYNRGPACWIKADVTFRGLLHLLHEPVDRVFLGARPPALDRVNANRTRYIRSVSFQKRSESTLAEHWFRGTVPLNHGLVAIVGNKGSGKSALADIIGLLGDSAAGSSFSFLNEEKFRRPKDNKAKHFEAEITWESDGTAKRTLDEIVDPSAVESVKYVPQSYLERVCNELGTGTENSFTQELRSVIFSHIDEPDRLGHQNLDALLQYHTEETAAAIALRRKDLEAAIETVVALEKRLMPSHRKALVNQLEMKKRELDSHKTAKPAEVPKPETTPETATAQAEIERKIGEVQTEISRLDKDIAAAYAKRTKAAKRVAAADRLLGRIANLEKDIHAFQTDSAGDCAELGLDVNTIMRIELSSVPVTDAKAKAANDIKETADAVRSDNRSGYAWKKAEKEKELEGLRATLDAPQQNYQRYLAQVEAWTRRRNEIVGSETTADSLRFLEHQLIGLDGLPAELDAAKARCLELTVAIFMEVVALTAHYRTVFQPVQRFITEHHLAKDRFHLQFEAAILPMGFESGFLALINQGRRGSFCGQEEGATRVRQLLRGADFSNEEGLHLFLQTMQKHLEFDMRQGQPEPIALETQLKKGVTAKRLYEYLYSLDYLRPHYTLRWAEKDIEQLSPGERGALLLVFYLLIDRSEIPLVIDQPEENLDNQSVYDILVPSIKEAKSRRQIIIVTHNPNLAVVCDADQIIHAAMDKESGNRITYTCGAIESPDMNRKVVDVLEGTRPAFENREGKYRSCEDLARRPRSRSSGGWTR